MTMTEQELDKAAEAIAEEAIRKLEALDCSLEDRAYALGQVADIIGDRAIVADEELEGEEQDEEDEEDDDDS
jgi:hypothetical protein